jgi:hypothetical protein
MNRRPGIDLSDAAVLIRLQDLVGIPFVVGGRTLEGADCLGIALMGLDVGFGIVAEDPWLSIEERWKAGKRDLAELFPAGWRQVLEGPPRPGDFLSILEDGTPSHIALMAPLGLTLSSQRKTKSMYVRCSVWEPRLHSIWRPQV